LDIADGAAASAGGDASQQASRRGEAAVDRLRILAEERDIKILLDQVRQDRRAAVADRDAAAKDRKAAAKDREAAAGDREATFADRQQAAVERAEEHTLNAEALAASGQKSLR
jgi:hypothetical protein